MKHKIIKTENYLLVVDDSEIKEDDWVFNSHKVEFAPQIYKMPPHPIEGEWWDEEELSTTKKITFHLPLNNAPVLEGVPLLPPLEDEVDKLSADYTEEWCGKRRVDVYIHDAFKAGHNKAKEKYKYTEEDILIIRNKLVSMLPKGDVSAWDMIVAASNYTKWFDQFIQSLQQPKYPVAFECEIVDTSNMGVTLSYPLTKTITNSQGQTVLVGTYKYE
jgi:hypothetical protein